MEKKKNLFQQIFIKPSRYNTEREGESTYLQHAHQNNTHLHLFKKGAEKAKNTRLETEKEFYYYISREFNNITLKENFIFGLSEG